MGRGLAVALVPKPFDVDRLVAEIRAAAAEPAGRVLGDAATSRDWATITKLHVLADGPRR